MSLREKMDATSGVVQYKTFQHPAFGEMRIRSLTEREYRMGYRLWFRDAEGNVIKEREEFHNVKLIQLCLVDDVGNLLYSDSLADLQKLVEMNEADIIPMFTECFDFNNYAQPKN